MAIGGTSPELYPKSGKRSSHACGDNQSETSWDAPEVTSTSYPGKALPSGKSDYKNKIAASGNDQSAPGDDYPKKRRGFGTEKSV